MKARQLSWKHAGISQSNACTFTNHGNIKVAKRNRWLQSWAFVILPFIFVHQHVWEWAGVSADRRGSEHENRQENDKNPVLLVSFLLLTISEWWLVCHLEINVLCAYQQRGVSEKRKPFQQLTICVWCSDALLNIGERSMDEDKFLWGERGKRNNRQTWFRTAKIPVHLPIKPHYSFLGFQDGLNLCNQDIQHLKVDFSIFTDVFLYTEYSTVLVSQIFLRIMK